MTKNPWWRAASLLGAVLLAVPAGQVVAVSAAAVESAAVDKAVDPKVDLKVLVVSDGSDMVAAYADRLTREGIPFEVLDLLAADRPALDDAYLTTPDAEAPHARFQGVIMPTSAPAGLSQAELTALHEFEARFGVRQISAYVWPSAEHGMNTPTYSGPVDGMSTTVSSAAKQSGFGYLKGTVKLDDFDSAVTESYGYLATPASTAGTTVTPLVTAVVPGSSTQGVLSGVMDDGAREELFNSYASNRYQQHFNVLAHGQLEWLTRGVHLGEYANWFSVHSDDVLMADALWNPEGNCTYGDDCDESLYPSTGPGTTARMTAKDVTFQKSWEAKWGLHVDVTYNGAGTAEYLEEQKRKSDPVLEAYRSSASVFRFINHTYSHPHLGCEQLTTGLGTWECARDESGNVRYVPQAAIVEEIEQNRVFASANGLKPEPTALVTGEHSGLRSLPQMPEDNPNLAPALAATGVEWVASDASREKEQRSVGSALTVPRYPMNIYYNTATREQAVDEYNWVYTARSDGGSGICEDNPATTSCIEPLSTSTGFQDYIVPLEARIATGHLLGIDPRPHYVHQSNQTQHRIIYPVLERLLTGYRGVFADNTPVVNPTMTEAGAELLEQTQWKTEDDVTAYYRQGQVHLSAGGDGATIPVSMPDGTTAAGTALPESYAGKDTGELTVAAGSTRILEVGPIAWGAEAPAAVQELRMFSEVSVPTGPSTTEIAPQEPLALVEEPVVGADPLAKPGSAKAGERRANPDQPAAAQPVGGN
ncbi:hypothetical protein QYM41_04540 [Kocuria sp. CPCC 205268]|uniref:hypothetical protein n=1 Tax=Kocuria oxytropis TaxID=3058913 RepID=UPI0034D5CFFD